MTKKYEDDLSRNYYKKFLELIVIFLDERLHHTELVFNYLARVYHLIKWMVNAIRYLKIFLFKNQFKLRVDEETALK